ncbi:enoyl-CoA hydratase/isomerase family protein [Streptomyces sp. ACA25]|uniref:enoyl-CoA hydratase/isomerase family protein n=1 Tax=Streptomyces sp. ACA25 TaxID=3022596 RepID=UPI0023075660|nr:enoyl-CoA hydratase/isomerase family protein [Streptomyces sp. ACA25]MDB1089773.1 enoyl-CoA hydratase/isomerase family protein [Streptomyces sp. ACA25]
MEPGLVCGAVEDGVATVTISHPSKRNAMTPDMWRRLPGLLSGFAADPAVRMLVLTGAGDTFCAGADIDSLRRDAAPRELAAAAEEALAAFPKPTLAVIRGHCVGGGCQLAAACDLRFAAEGAVFGVTPARLGLVYPPSSTQRLVRLVGPSSAKYLLLSAELIGTERALRTGLVDEVWPADALQERVTKFTEVLASRSQLTQSAAKEYADRPASPDRIAYWTGQALADGEAAEGVAAFLERRTPRFSWSVDPGPSGSRP